MGACLWYAGSGCPTPVDVQHAPDRAPSRPRPLGCALRDGGPFLLHEVDAVRHPRAGSRRSVPRPGDSLADMAEAKSEITRGAPAHRPQRDRPGRARLRETFLAGRKPRHGVSRDTAEIAGMTVRLTNLARRSGRTARRARMSLSRAPADGAASLGAERAVSRRRCEFGKRYDPPEGQAMCAKLTALAEVERPHEDSHAMIGDLVQLRTGAGRPRPRSACNGSSACRTGPWPRPTRSRRGRAREDGPPADGDRGYRPGDGRQAK